MLKLNNDDLKEKWITYRELVPVGSSTIPRLAKALRDELITTYLPVADNQALRMRAKLPNHIELDDLKQWATLGLLEAVQSYDPERGVVFEAFAVRRIHGKIIDSLRVLDWAPRGLRKQQRDIAKTEDALQRVHNRKPTTAEVAEALDFSEKEIADIKHRADAATHAYLEETPEMEIAPYDIEQSSDIQHLKDLFVDAVNKLTYEEKIIIVLCYYDNKRLSEIKSMPGFENINVGVLHTEAVLKIWHNVQQGLAA